MSLARKIIYVSLAAIMGFSVMLYFMYSMLISSKLVFTSVTVRPYFKPVLIEQYKSYFFGSYWENEMVYQAELVAKLPLRERLEFYKSIVIYCDLDTSRALIFVELVYKDAKALSDKLLKFRRDKQFESLSEDNKDRVAMWADELARIADREINMEE
jgi:hypothetical protein